MAITSIYLFGNSLNPDIFVNLQFAGNAWPTIVMRIAFLFVTIAHIPFIFFAAKECFLSILDEIMRKSISETLSRKILNYTVTKSGTNDCYVPDQYIVK